MIFIQLDEVWVRTDDIVVLEPIVKPSGSWQGSDQVVGTRVRLRYGGQVETEMTPEAIFTAMNPPAKP